MGFLDILLPWRQVKSAAYEQGLRAFIDVYGGRSSRSGKEVNWKTALECSVVLGCVRVRAEGTAQVPFRVYRDGERGPIVAKDHYLNALLRRRPNPWQSRFEFRETLVAHLDLTNNAFVFVNRVGSKREIRELIPIEPQRVTVKAPTTTLGGRPEYKVRGDDGREMMFPADAIWHLRGLSWNGWLGLDAMRMAREAIGLGMAIEHGQAEFHKHGAQTSGLYSTKAVVSQEKFAFLAEWIDKHLPGGERFGKPLIGDMEASWTPFGMTGVEAQLLETRKFQIEEICRHFRVQPIMVGHADKTATYASAEQMFIAHVVHCLEPLYERIAASADVNLLSDADLDAGYYLKFTPAALMRGAAKDRAEFYAKGLGSGGSDGWMRPNDVRAFEEMELVDDGWDLPKRQQPQTSKADAETTEDDDDAA